MRPDVVDILLCKVVEGSMVTDEFEADHISENVGEAEVIIGWMEYGRYFLYLIDVNSVPAVATALEDLVDKFEELASKRVGTLSKHISEMMRLQWIDMDEVQDMIVSSEKPATCEAEPDPSSSRSSRNGVLSNFANYCFRNDTVGHWLRNLSQRYQLDCV
jgi:hypothetical protein